MNDTEVRKLAVKRLEDKRDFRQHLAIYLLVSVALCLIWFVMNRGGYFWPVWPMFAWGVGVVGHALQTYGSKPITASDVEREMATLAAAAHEEAAAMKRPEGIHSS